MPRLSTTLARSGLALALSVAALPLGVSAAQAAVPSALPHPAGGYLPSAGRVEAKVRGSLGPHTADALPDSVDLRANAPAVGDQQQVSACVAWTLGYSIMGYYAAQDGDAGAPYSPLYMYMRNVKSGGAPTTGLAADYVLPYTQANGIDTQDDYWQGNYNYKLAPTTAENASAKNYKVTGWTRLFNGANQGAAAQTVIEQQLAAGTPVALGIPVYRDFMNLRAHTLYTTVGAATIGLHMVAVYGYDADGIIIRNSWGTGWGNDGDAHLSWAFVTKAAISAYTISGVTTPSSPVATTPSVVSLSLGKAVAGTKLTITGSSLAGATSVRFGDTDADFTAQAADGTTKLVVTAPAHVPGIVDVTVTNATGTSAVATADKFTYVPPPPTVTTLDPATGTVFGGTTVTLTGTDLTGVSAVKVGTTSVPAKAVTSTALTFIAPAHVAGTVPVTVTTASGISATPGQLTYVNPPAPVVTDVSPATGPTYRTTPVVITGTDFTGATKLTLNGATVPFSKVSGTQIKATLPVHAAGDASLVVTTPGGTSTGSSFSYVAPAVPVISSLSANALTSRATPLVLTGTGLTDASKVTVGGTAISFTKVSDTELHLVVPAKAAGTLPVVVTTPGGPSASVDLSFTLPPVPTVISLSSMTVPARKTLVVQVTGTDFTGVSRALLGGNMVTVVVVSDTVLKVTLPPKPANNYDLVIMGPGGSSAPTSITYTA
jgi:hypothetical protein